MNQQLTVISFIKVNLYKIMLRKTGEDLSGGGYYFLKIAL